MVFRPVRAARVAVVGVLLAVGLGALTNTSDAAPAGFSIETMPFGGLIQPTGVEFAANGQVFVAERRGVIKVYDNVADSSSRETADLRLRVYNNGDRGLLGMVLDPQYPTRPYLYALYTKDAEPDGTVPKYGNATTDTDPCPVGGGANDCRVSAELSRLTLDPATGTWTGQEALLLGGWCQQYGSHTIGTVLFGTDGYLYVGSGDAASYNAVDTGNLGTQRCSDASGWGGALRSQAARRPVGTPVVPHGAILRIDPDTGAAAPGNPFAGDADPVRQRIIAYGLRNPYRFTARPGTNEIWVGDVGWNAFEELNKVVVDGTAENFGWPCYEGTGRQSGYDNANTPACETLYTQGAGAVTPPNLAYAHGQPLGGSGCGTGGSSVSAVAFPSGATSYPAAYRSGVFFGDYSRRCLWFANMSGGNIDSASVTVFDATVYPAELQAGPNGDLYAVDIATNQVKRIRYNVGGNTPPMAVAQASPTSGPTPLAVQFDGSGSGDPDAGSSISYAWDLDGDGAFDDSTAVSPTWTYTVGGSVIARLRVTDNLGATDTDSVVITPDSSAPVVSLNSAAATTPWRVGDQVSFTVSAADAEDGSLPSSALTTRLVIKHCPDGTTCHEHTQQTFAGTGSGSFTAPDHEYPAWLELQATATDSDGATGTAALRLDPAVVNLTIQTVPNGLRASVGGQERTTPFTVPVIQRSINTIAVPTPQTSGGTYAFASWSDGGAVSHTVTADAPATYTASFTEVSAPTPPGLVGSWGFDDGAGATARDSSPTGANGTLEGGPSWTTAGRHGGALSFDGVDDRVTVADRNAFDLTTAGTLTAWVRPSATRSWDQVLLKERPGGLAYALYGSGVTAGRPNGSLGIGGTDVYADAPAALPLNTWSHLAMTFDGTTMRLYVDGTQVATRAQPGPVAASTGALRIGGNAVWGEWFSGRLDEVRLYDRALTAAQVVSDSTTPTTVDSVPPTTPGNVRAAGGVSSVSLTWDASTDNAATPTYEVHRSGVNGFSPSSSTRIASGLTATSYADTGVAPGTHYYRVIASDGVNSSAPSAQAQAVVTGDTQAPSVPGGVAASVSGDTATVTWNASTDDVGVTAYQVQRTGGPGGAVTFSVAAPTRSVVDAGLAPGTYEYAVRARDLAGNWSAFSGAVQAPVTADLEPPTVTVTAPTSGATVSGQVTLSASASDDTGVVGVQFRVDGVAVGAEDTSPPYSVTWSSSSVANGSHAVTAVARDAAGRSTTSPLVTVTVANTGPSGLVGGWSFDEGSGPTAGDRSGRGNNGTLTGGPSWTASGRHGGALVFDGVNDLVTIPDAASLDLTNQLTMAAWVRPTALGSWRQVLLKERPGGLAYALYATNNASQRPNATLTIGADREVNAPAALATNTWTHLAMTYDGAAMRLYVNGSQVATRNQTGSTVVSAGPLQIGGNTIWNSEWFTGAIDDVRLYNRALTATEVVAARDNPL